MAVSSGPQYGSLERAWVAIMTEADKVSELHQDVKNNLLNEDLEKVKNWQKDAYHKQIMGGFRETKEAEDGFRKAQKPWAKKMKEVPSGGTLQMGRGRAAEPRGPGWSEGGCLQMGWRCTVLWDCATGAAGRIHGQGRYCGAHQAVPRRETSSGRHCSQVPGATACILSAS